VSLSVPLLRRFGGQRERTHTRQDGTRTETTTFAEVPGHPKSSPGEEGWTPRRSVAEDGPVIRKPVQFQVQGARLSADRWEGPGAPVVLLHAGVADRRSWYATVDQLMGVGTVVAYDRRGFGDSPPSQVPFEHLDDLIAVLDQLGEGPAWLVGSSNGGKVALDAALAHPDRVAGLVLLASPRRRCSSSVSTLWYRAVVPHRTIPSSATSTSSANAPNRAPTLLSESASCAFACAFANRSWDCASYSLVRRFSATARATDLSQSCPLRRRTAYPWGSGACRGRVLVVRTSSSSSSSPCVTQASWSSGIRIRPIATQFAFGALVTYPWVSDEA